MTLRVEISIVPFGEEDKKKVLRTINVHNIKQLEIDPVEGPICEYEVQDADDPDLIVPNITHARADGALVLSRAALEGVEWAEWEVTEFGVKNDNTPF